LKTKCLKCGETLYETVPLDALGDRPLNRAHQNPSLEYDLDSGNVFMKCPHCGEKNGFRAVGGVFGSPVQLVLDRVLE